MRADGAEPVLLDLETAGADEVAAAIDGAEAVVFAAGAGPGSGAERKMTVDRDGAVALVRAAEAAGVEPLRHRQLGRRGGPARRRRRLQRLPAREGAGRPGGHGQQPGLDRRAAGAAHRRPGAGTVRLETEPYRADVTRDDVARVVAATLAEPRSVRHILYVIAGDDPIEQALSEVAGA